MDVHSQARRQTNRHVIMLHSIIFITSGVRKPTTAYVATLQSFLLNEHCLALHHSADDLMWQLHSWYFEAHFLDAALACKYSKKINMTKSEIDRCAIEHCEHKHICHDILWTTMVMGKSLETRRSPSPGTVPCRCFWNIMRQLKRPKMLVAFFLCQKKILQHSFHQTIHQEPLFAKGGETHRGIRPESALHHCLTCYTGQSITKLTG